MPRVAIALGSNQGDRLGHINAALSELSKSVAGGAVSPMYETAPMYVKDQASFLNGVLVGQTSLGPLALLKELKRIEKSIGRTQTQRYGPREVDLDLIIYGRLTYRFLSSGARRLEVPHPMMGERRFVLKPLFDVWHKLEIPRLGSLAHVLIQTDHQAKDVVLYDHAVFSV